MQYGYARVSTKTQKEDRQLIALEKYEERIDKIFVDKESGKDFNRDNYKRLINRLKEGDVMIVKSIDRLGRNYNEILEQWRLITKVKNADIVVLDMPILNTAKNKDLLGTLISDLVLQLLSYVAENERLNIRQRQAEGIEVAKAKGVTFGRKQKYNPTDYKEVLKRVVNREITAKEAMKIMGVSESTYHRIRRKLSDIGRT
jgi:DNA invertase Pin-like site-specific DNA recombinase